MKKLLISLCMIFTLAAPVFVAPTVSAVDVLNPGGTNGPCNNPNATNKPDVCVDNKSTSNENPIFGPDGIITAVVRILSLIVGISSVIIIVISGLRLILAGGDSNTAATARRSVIYSCVALVVAVMGQAIITLILNKL
jgi:hypothetical protein